MPMGEAFEIVLALAEQQLRRTVSPEREEEAITLIRGLAASIEPS